MSARTPAESLHIRPMNAADLARILRIAASLPDAPQWPPQVYAVAIDPDHAPKRIAMVAGEPVNSPGQPRCQIVAFAIASLVPPEAELETIAVAPAAQRRGIGSLLLIAMRNELKLLQVSLVNLEVRASNRNARSFYRARGFSESGVRRGYYADPEEDAIFMQLKLG